MTTNPIRRALTTLLVVAMMLAGTALPALAVAQGSATITQGADLLSGMTDQTVVIEVTNDASSGGIPVLDPEGSSIDLVQVVPPTDLFDTTDFTPAAFTGPAGWTAFVQSDVIRFRADDDSELPPGQTAEFTLELDVLSQPSDAADNFFVSVSDDDGRVLTTAGVPEVVVRTLQVVTDTIDVIKPTFADVQDGTFVTEQQDNADIAVTIRNLGSQAQDVTPSISKSSGSSSIATGSASSEPILAGGQHTFVVDSTFGNQGTLVLKASATSEQGSEAVELIDGDTITVQEAISLQYVSQSLSPRGINPGDPADPKPTDNPTPSFELQVNKDGGPASNTGATDLSLNIDGLSTSASITVPAGDTNNILVTFPELDVTSLADGTYTPTLDYGGIDANGADIVPNTRTVDKILIDRLNALVNITLTPPASAVDYPNIVDAASFDDSVAVGGTAERGGEACGDCTVTSAVAMINGRPIPAANVSVSVGPDGSVNGSVEMPDGSPEQVGTEVDAFTYKEGDDQVTLDLTVGRTVEGIESPNAGSGSAQAPVDIIRPDLLAPQGEDLPKTGTVTGRDADGDFVDVIFSEPVNFGQFGSNAADWLVDGATVSDVEYPPSDKTVTDDEGNEQNIENSGQATDRIRLRLLEKLPNNAEPTATYDPQDDSGLFAPTGFDRVELAFTVPDTVNVADGIAPDPLDLLTVSTYREATIDNDANRVDLGPVDGNFVTRDTTPVLTVADVLPGDDVTVFADADQDGVHDAGEGTLGTGSNLGTEQADVEITLSIGGSEPINLGAYATDANQNDGMSLTGFTLTLDQTNITITDFSVSGQNISVTMSEAITDVEGYAGRDAAIDWFVYSEGRWRPVETVSNVDGDAATRTLNVHSKVVSDTSTITRVRYEYVNFGEARAEEERYLDRALNEMIDGFFEKTG